MATESSIEFKGISRFVEGTSSVERQAIPDGSYELDQLLGVLVDGWLPYWECHKCGRFMTCPHVERFDSYPNRARDIQCGVAKLALRNFLMVSWEKLVGFSDTDKQHFVDGLFHWTQYVLNAEIDIGSYTSEELINSRGNRLSRRIMSYLTMNRRHLERFSYYFRNLSDFVEAPFWVLVEGESEKAFIERLLELRAIDFRVLGVETYSGKGNRKLRKLHLEHLDSRGFRVVLQADTDGAEGLERSGLAENLRDQGGVFFAFDPDFESVFPPPVLHRALELLNVSTSSEGLRELMESGAGRIVATIEQMEYVDISKVDLARRLADLVHEHLHIMERDWPDNAITQWVVYLKHGEGYDVFDDE